MRPQSYEVRALLDLLCDPAIPDGRERIDTIGGATHAASLLFRMIKAQHGDDAARRIFTMFAPLTKARHGDIENESLLDLHDTMRWKLDAEDDAARKTGQPGRWVENMSLNRAAKTLTDEGYVAKAGGPNWENLRRHIRRLRERYGKPDKPPD